jgi:uncharacterized membrane protein YvbJ
MIICKNCQHENVSGTLFCTECGAQLDGIETLTTQTIAADQIAEDLSKKPVNMEPPSSPLNSWILFI